MKTTTQKRREFSPQIRSRRLIRDVKKSTQIILEILDDIKKNGVPDSISEKDLSDIYENLLTIYHKTDDIANLVSSKGQSKFDWGMLD